MGNFLLQEILRVSWLTPTFTQKQKVLAFSYASENKPLPFGESGMVAFLPHTILRNKVSTISYLGKELLEISDNKNPGDWQMLTSAKKNK